MKKILLVLVLAGCSPLPEESIEPLTDAEFGVEADVDMLNSVSSLAEDLILSFEDDTSLATALAQGSNRSSLFRRPGNLDCPTIAFPPTGTANTRIVRQYEACTRVAQPSGTSAPTINGSTTYLIERAAEAGNAVSRTVISERDLRFLNVFTLPITIVSNTTYSLAGTFPNLTATDSIFSFTRTRRTAAGGAARTYEVTGSLDFQTSGPGADSIDQIATSGTLRLEETGGAREVEYELASVRWSNLCCHPVAGTIQKEVILSGVHESEVALTFSGQCGTMLVNGTSLTLPGCE